MKLLGQEQNVTDRLCAAFGRRYCCLTGRGATAIYLALKTLPRSGGKVIVPDILCPSPANVVLYAGFEPLFCDVSLADANLDVDALQQLLIRERDVAAILPAHLYGQPARMDRIMELARERSIPVIEDVAQAMGGTYHGRPLGAFGDVSILSFGHTKILDVGWSGAVMTDSAERYEIMRAEQEKLPSRPSDINRRYAENREVYYTLASLAERNEHLHALFLPLPEIFRDMYLFRPDATDLSALLTKLAALGDVVRQRCANAAAYQRRLVHPRITPLTMSEEGVPWRFSFLLRDDGQKTVTERLRACGVDVSNWYPPLHRWYASGRRQDERLLRNADFIGRHVVNLWVTPETTLGSIQKACDSLLGILDDVNEQA